MSKFLEDDYDMEKIKSFYKAAVKANDIGLVKQALQAGVGHDFFKNNAEDFYDLIRENASLDVIKFIVDNIHKYTRNSILWQSYGPGAVYLVVKNNNTLLVAYLLEQIKNHKSVNRWDQLDNYKLYNALMKAIRTKNLTIIDLLLAFGVNYQAFKDYANESKLGYERSRNNIYYRGYTYSEEYASFDEEEADKLIAQVMEMRKKETSAILTNKDVITDLTNLITNYL